MTRQSAKGNGNCRWVYQHIVKRLLDLIGVTILAVPALVIIGCCMIAIKAESKGPAFFKQERPGYRGKIYKIFKLRTMITQTHLHGEALTDFERMTRTGKVIRALSLDELPQLLNILKGEMSFIGPRPLLVQYLPLYSAKQAKRHNVLPGISGWAQVNGRNALSWEDKFDYDVWYVEHIGFLLDAKILLLTISNVLRRNGINESSGNTMKEFGKQ